MFVPDSINRRIAALALPAVASNITVPLLGLCDTAVTGHLGEAAFLAAISAGGMMLNVIFWVFGFLRMGTTGLTASAHGADDGAGVSRVLSRAVALAALAGVAIICVRQGLLSILVNVIGADERVAALSSEYFNICIWGAPALLVTLSINGWFIGMQTTFWPMVVSIAVNIVNVVCSLVAVFLLDMGFHGVAVGTLVANWLGLLLAIVALLRFGRGQTLWCGWSELWRGGELRRFFGVSADLFLRSSCIMIVSLAVTAYGARLGELTLAVNAVMMQFFVLFSYFMDGLAFSGEALCGKSAGASDRGGVVRAVKALIGWGIAAAAVFCAVYTLLLPQVAGLLTDVADVRSGVVAMRAFVALIPPVSAAAFLFDGFFIGLTATRRMLLTTFGATAIFFTIIIFGPGVNITLWCAFLAYLLVRGLGLAIQLPVIVGKIKSA